MIRRIWIFCLVGTILAWSGGVYAASLDLLGVVFSGSGQVAVTSYEGVPDLKSIEKTFSSLDYIDMLFEVVPDTTTNYFYQFDFQELITNDTDSKWTDFHFELGYGSGANFYRSSSTDWLLFLDPPAPTVTPSGTFGDYDLMALSPGVDPNLLSWQGGDGIGPGDSATFTFSIRTPRDVFVELARTDLQPEIQPFQFTLRQYATVVPEPGSLLLLGTGLAGLARFARGRRRD